MQLIFHYQLQPHVLFPKLPLLSLISFVHLSICRVLLVSSLTLQLWSLCFFSIPLHCCLTLLFLLVTGLLVSLPVWLFVLSHRMMHFSFVWCMVFASFTITLHLSLKLSFLLFPLEVAGGNCYCRRYIVLLVVTFVLGRRPMLYCHVFGGLVCLEMCLLLFEVVVFASAQSLVLNHPQVYCTLLRLPKNDLRFGQQISSLTYPHVVDSMGFILVLIS